MNEESTAKYSEDMDKVVTMGVLVEYTGEFLIPKIEEVVQDSEQRLREYVGQEIGRSENRMMGYIDRKLADHTLELFKRLEHRFQAEHQFKDKVVELFKRHNIGTLEDIAFLDGLVKGGW